MSKNLVLVSHGELCTALKQSTEMIMGTQSNIYAVPLLPQESSDDYRVKLEQVLSELDDYVVLADLLGGTPCNVASKLIMEGKNFQLYAGMNMPMVIGFINGILLGEEVDLIEFGATNIKNINELIAGNNEEDEDE